MKHLFTLVAVAALVTATTSGFAIAQELAVNEKISNDGSTASDYNAAYASPRHGYYQPAPASLRSHFAAVGAPNQILGSGTVDLDKSTVTLPLYRGKMKDGRKVWYVITDVSDQGLAQELGINYSPKLRNVAGRAIRTATPDVDGSLIFERGTVDFSPIRHVVPGKSPNFFPPAEAVAGSKGDAFYTPIVRVGDVIYNATVVAFDVNAASIEFPNGGVDYSKVIDRAISISPTNGTVTFSLTVGTMDGRPMLFISLDSNDNLVSALEGTTYAPALSDIPVGLNDSPNSAVAANYIVMNGPTGADNPQRQGLNSALSDKDGQVLDVFDSAPGLFPGYSPMWDLYLARWSQKAIDRNIQSAIYSELQMLTLIDGGWIEGPDGPVGASGLISNCPLVMSF